MKLTIPMTEFVARREKLLEQMKPNSVAVFPASRELTRSRDTEFPFRQDSDFFYLTGFPEPNAYLIIEKLSDSAVGAEQASITTLVCRVKDKTAEIWQGRRIGKDKAKTEFMFDQTADETELEQTLQTAINNKATLYFGQGEYDYADELVFKTLQTLRMGPKKGWSAPTELLDVRPIVHNMRLFKSDAEIEVMRQAGKISAEAHARAMKFAAQQSQKGEPVFEYQLEAEIHHHFAMNGARYPAYGTIVGGGENACILHYTENQDEVKSGDLVLIDSGCELQGYAADITRTWPVNGKYSEEQKVIYEVVLDAQLAVLEAISPDASLKSLTDISIRKITEGLVRLGIIKTPESQNGVTPEQIDDLIANNAHRAFYMHGLAHWLGLDVHDVGDYNQAGAQRGLQPGMIFTVEPGIYIDSEADCDPKWHGIGVRIEDNILITDNGYENLTADVPKTIEEIEALMR
ncbi:Xaa-Pro aminopeptidase [Psychrosphaera ytuae]|nr:Xaa-Pro aminopeptidase [Psychrosphaera ytuae]